MIDNNTTNDIYNFLPHVSKEFILSKINESDIFSRYLYYPDLNKTFVNPFRDDKNPDCRFYISNLSKSSRSLRFKDFAYGYNWSCFDVVMVKYGLEFNKALQKIAIDFDLFNLQNIPIDDNIKNSVIKLDNNISLNNIAKSIVDLQIKKRRFNKYDLEYWEQYNLQLKDLYYVYPLDNVFLNKKTIYFYNNVHNDPAYGYGLGYNGKYKIYFPKRVSASNKKYRFLQSGNYTQGIRLLPKHNLDNGLLFITKSYKDVLMLRKLGFYAIAPSSETSVINTEEMENMKTMFTDIVLFFDNDNAGKFNSNKFKSIYNIENEIFIPDGYSKDISDFIANEANKDLDSGIDLIAHLIETQTNINFNYDKQKINLSSY